MFSMFSSFSSPKVLPSPKVSDAHPRRTHNLRGALVASLFLLATGVPIDADAQTLQEALEASWHNNIAFAIEKRKVQEAFEVARRAAIDLGPTINLQGSYGVQAQRNLEGGENDAKSFDPTQAWSASVGLKQSLLQSGQVYANHAIASYNRRIVLLRLHEFEAQLILDGLQRYLGVLERSATLRVRRKSESQLEEQWHSVRRESSFGGASARDVALAAASLAEARAQTIEARNADKSARRAFRDHFGIEVQDKSEGEGEGELKTPQHLPQPPQTIEAAQTLALQKNFALRAARLEWKKQKKVARSTRGLVFLPRISLEANYAVAEQKRSTNDSFSTKLTFSYPLRPAYFMSGYRSVLNALRLARDGARLAEQNTRRQLLDAWEAFGAAKESEKARQETLQARAIVLQSAQRETRLGTGDLDDLLEAERNFAEAERAAIVAKRQTLVSQVQLLKVTGTLSPALLQLEVPVLDVPYFRRWNLSVEP